MDDAEFYARAVDVKISFDMNTKRRKYGING